MTPTLRGLGGRALWRMNPKPLSLSSRRILGLFDAAAANGDVWENVRSWHPAGRAARVVVGLIAEPRMLGARRVAIVIYFLSMEIPKFTTSKTKVIPCLVIERGLYIE